MLLAAGKAVHELEAERTKRGDTSTAILRLEQYYPLPTRELADELAKYPEAELVVVQDEPQNQGAWPFLALNLPSALAEVGVILGSEVERARRAVASRARIHDAW